MKRGFGTVDRRALEQRPVRVLVAILALIGVALIVWAPSEPVFLIAGMAFIVVASVLAPARHRRAERDPVQD